MNISHVVNSVEKVDLPEHAETFFQFIVPTWDIDSISHATGLDTFCSAQQNLLDLLLQQNC